MLVAIGLLAVMGLLTIGWLGWDALHAARPAGKRRADRPPPLWPLALIAGVGFVSFLGLADAEQRGSSCQGGHRSFHVPLNNGFALEGNRSRNGITDVRVRRFGLAAYQPKVQRMAHRGRILAVEFDGSVYRVINMFTARDSVMWTEAAAIAAGARWGADSLQFMNAEAFEVAHCSTPLSRLGLGLLPLVLLVLSFGFFVLRVAAE